MYIFLVVYSPHLKWQFKCIRIRTQISGQIDEIDVDDPGYGSGHNCDGGDGIKEDSTQFFFELIGFKAD